MKRQLIYILPIYLLLGFLGTAQIEFGGGDPIDGPVPKWYEDYDKDGWGNFGKEIQSYNRPHGYIRRGGDCNDRDPSIFPKRYYRDGDGDGFGTNSSSLVCVSGTPSGYATGGGDCNDDNADIHPNTRWYADSDGDGFGDDSDVYRGCTRPNTFPIRILKGGDCNDDNPAIHPNTVWYYDNDGDGFASSTKVQCSSPGNKWTYLSKPVTDCNDNNKLIHPNTVWYKNSDGDGFASTTKKQCTNPGAGYSLTVKPLGDCNDSNPAIHPDTVWYKNSDGDGFASTTKKQCTNPGAGYSLTVKPLGDCNDGNKLIHPNTVWYKNSDGDGFASTTKKQCTNPGAGYSLTVKPLGDCNDSNPAIHPDTVWYKNSDGDGFASTTKKQCTNPGAGYSLTVKPLGDCNDNNDQIHPNTVWYKNSDGDGFASTTKKQCTNPGAGYSLTVKPLGDCDDNNDQIHPNTVWYKNSDGDGFASTTKKQCTNPGAGYSLTVKPLGDLDDNNGLITNIPPKNFYRDVDKDTFGDPSTKTYRSVAPSDGYTYVTNGNDYDDSTANIIDIVPKTFYLDSDGDGFGDPNHSVLYSIQPTGYVLDNTDQCPAVFGENQGCSDAPYQAVTLSNENYVFTQVFQSPMQSENGIQYTKDVIESITYFDGLGRPKQQVGIKASPTAKDIVTHITYDQYGRQAKQYLPFERPTGTSTPLGSYASVDIVSDINTYYKSVYDTDFTVAADHQDFNAYSESIFEPSPLNRVQEQGAPGSAWKANKDVDTDHTIKFDWDTNQLEEVIKFRIQFTGSDTESPTLVKQEFYPVGELQVTITKDENWTVADGNNHTTREYTDKRGRVVLKRTYNTTPNTSGGSAAAGGGEAHDTYYIYDDFDNLTYIIPPKVTTVDGVSATEMSELCYQYKYDYRNRLIEKKIPGKGWESIVYNKLDQPILTQDANLKAEAAWLFTKYDALGRVAYTGKITITGKTRTLLQAEATAYSDDIWVDKTTTGIRYDDGGYPKVTTGETLTINYYDDYEFDIAGLVSPGTVSGEAITNRTRSLPTGSKVKVLGEDKWITTVTYYDKKARPIYIASKNEYLNTTDTVESELDFVGKVLKTKTTHTKGSNAAIVTVDTFTYDHMGRAKKQTQQINNQDTEVIAENTYDALGQLKSKKIGGGLQDVDYSYNVRGWMTGINDVENLGNDLFSFGIHYNKPKESLGAYALYNGNISETIWKTVNDNTKRGYVYGYDKLNRIIRATHSNGDYNVAGIRYDKMGNIIALNRNGHVNDEATLFGSMDRLSYTYDDGNKLLKVTDTGNKTYGFKDGTNTNDDYDYDTNGNMIKDQNKGITSITYNHLNLPETVSISNSEGTGTISYIYDATGAKLKKTAPSGSSLITTEYTGNYVYRNNELQYMSTPEGYATPEGNSYRYVYQFKDHLDNVRLSYTKNAAGDLEIIEENNYYPFGLKHRGYNSTVSSLGNSTAQLLGFGGKEEQDELGLGWIDITARNYDPALGRWMNLDPLAEQMRRHSPYNYAFDNPIYFIDPDGMKPFGSGDPKKKRKGPTPGQVVRWQIKNFKRNMKRFFSFEPGKRLDQKGEGLSIWGKNKSHEGSTQDNGESKGSVDVKDVPGGPPTVKGTKGLKKLTDVVKAFKNGQKDADAVKKIAEKTIDLVSETTSESDTTVTATFADGIESTGGTAIFGTVKDSTATMTNTKDKVEDFNNSAEQSLKDQQNKVDKILENRNN